MPDMVGHRRAVPSQRNNLRFQACTDFPGPQLTSIRVNALIPVVKMRTTTRGPNGGVDSASATYNGVGSK